MNNEIQQKFNQFTLTFSLLFLRQHSVSSPVQGSTEIASLLNRLDSKKSSSLEQVNAVKGVLYRLLPTHLSCFQFKIITKYEWYARTQMTMWYDTTKHVQSKLHDYANKFWSGLLKGYYHPRSSMYFTRLSHSLKANEDFKLDTWREEWIAFSNKWQAGKEIYPVKAQGDAFAIAKDLYQKYFT